MAPRETDLNELVLHVRQQLAALIEKNNARIDQQPLPTLPVEPSSIALVLQNLIMNVLKYRHRDVPPEIVVSSIPMETLAQCRLKTMERDSSRLKQSLSFSRSSVCMEARCPALELDWLSAKELSSDTAAGSVRGRRGAWRKILP